MPWMMSFSPFLRVTAASLLVCAGCSSGGSAPADAYINSTLGRSPLAGSTGTCNINEPNSPFLTIGSAGAPVPTGGNYMGTPVTVTCTVRSTGTDSFEVSATIVEGQLGQIDLNGTLTSTAGTSQPNVVGTFDALNTGNYNEQDCTVALMADGNGKAQISAGRVWGTLTCPTATDSGSGTSGTCYATAEFKLENCTQ